MINVPQTFYKEIQHKALDEDVSVTEFVIKAVKKYIIKNNIFILNSD